MYHAWEVSKAPQGMQCCHMLWISPLVNYIHEYILLIIFPLIYSPRAVFAIPAVQPFITTSSNYYLIAVASKKSGWCCYEVEFSCMLLCYLENNERDGYIE